MRHSRYIHSKKKELNFQAPFLVLQFVSNRRLKPVLFWLSNFSTNWVLIDDRVATSMYRLRTRLYINRFLNVCQRRTDKASFDPQESSLNAQIFNSVYPSQLPKFYWGSGWGFVSLCPWAIWALCPLSLYSFSFVSLVPQEGFVSLVPWRVVFKGQYSGC